MSKEPMIAPCGVDCSRCTHYMANTKPDTRKQGGAWSETLGIPVETITCNGCRAHTGRIPLQLHLFGDDHRCAIFGCAQKKKVEYCGFCDRFPCQIRHPYNEKAALLDQETRVVLEI